MKLTGKCREDFEKWFMSSNVFNLNLLHLQNIQVFDRTKHFYKYPKSMQYGVYADYFNTKKYEGVELFDKCFSVYFYQKTIFQTHNDIVKQAIEKANEIYNLNQ